MKNNMEVTWVDYVALTLIITAILLLGHDYFKGVGQ